MGKTLKLSASLVELPLLFAGVRKNQVPFAAAVAMTRTAQDALEELRSGVAQRFTIRRKSLIANGPQSTLRVITASKRDWPHPSAGIGIVDQFFARHEEGGVQRPERASSFAVPTRRILVRRLPGGAIPKYWRPSTMRAQNRAIREDDKILQKEKRGSLVQAGIVYLLHRRVRLAARLGGRSTLDRVSRARFHHHFERELTNALRSERVRAGSFTSAQGRFFYLKARNSLSGLANYR